MSKEKSESLHFYDYLCRKIGCEKVVRIRRLAFTISDIGKKDKRITSGSKGEGLDLKHSDLDLMYVDSNFKVYQSEAEVIDKFFMIPLIMNTEETQPCFTQLCLLNRTNQMLQNTLITSMNLTQKSHLGYMLSSEQYKIQHLNATEVNNPDFLGVKVHGPCISDRNDVFDLAWCLKCDKWIDQAKPWISRPRTTWPPPEIISKIVSCGVLFVPIGCKGSMNEHLEWRISFSVAEKILIFSFSHTQFLCYAMLKILLKEIVEKHDDLKGLLCSYFLKTLMFWISEETDPYLWRPENMIPCFMACLQKLLYCVRQSILLHYFIYENNLLYTRFNINNKEKLSAILKNLYGQGIHCFASSVTLQDYQSQPYVITQSLIFGNSIFLQHIKSTFSLIRGPSLFDRFSKLLYDFLHHSGTGLCKSLFALHLSKSFMSDPETIQNPNRSENKHLYFRYKQDLSHLVIGLHSDAVSGLLKLASFFYVHKNYIASFTVITYTLQKYTDEKIDLSILNENIPLKYIKQHAVKLMNKEKLNAIIKSLTIYPVVFKVNSSIIPQELHQDVKIRRIMFHPLPFAHFLRFLCYYRSHDFTLCRHSLQQLRQVQRSLTKCCTHTISHISLNTVIMLGLCYQFMGETNLAVRAFQEAAELDKGNETSAAYRLFSLI